MKIIFFILSINCVFSCRLSDSTLKTLSYLLMSFDNKEETLLLDNLFYFIKHLSQNILDNNFIGKPNNLSRIARYYWDITLYSVIKECDLDNFTETKNLNLKEGLYYATQFERLEYNFYVGKYTMYDKNIPEWLAFSSNGVDENRIDRYITYPCDWIIYDFNSNPYEICSYLPVKINLEDIFLQEKLIYNIN